MTLRPLLSLLVLALGCSGGTAHDPSGDGSTTARDGSTSNDGSTITNDGSTTITPADTVTFWTAQTCGGDLAVDDKYLYFSTSIALSGDPGLYRMAKDGTGMTKLSGDVVSQLAVSSTSLFWMESDAANQNTVVMHAGLDGSNPTSLAPVVADAAAAIAAIGDVVFWTDMTGLHSVHADGTGNTLVDADGAYGLHLVAANGRIYYPAASELRSIAPDGTDRKTVTPHYLSSFAVDEHYAYGSTGSPSGNDALYRFDLATGEEKLLTFGGGIPAASNGGVYFAYLSGVNFVKTDGSDLHAIGEVAYTTAPIQHFISDGTNQFFMTSSLSCNATAVGRAPQ